MEFGLLLLTSMTLIASTASSILNIKGTLVVYSDLSSADNSFNCEEPASHILLGQKASTVVFAASSEPCLFPNTYSHDGGRQGDALEIFQKILSHVVASGPH